MSIPCHSHNVGMVVVGHGSQVPAATVAFQEQVALLAAMQGGIIEHGFLEFETPQIAEAIDHAIVRGAETVVVVPAMLTDAHHVKIDIPNIIRFAQDKHPLIPICYAKHIALHGKILELCKKRIEQALSEENLNLNKTLLMVVGRGSSDASGNQDVVKLAHLLGESFHFGETRYSYTSVAKPLFKDVLESCGHQAILVLPYLLFRGVLVTKLEERVQQFQAAHHDTVVKLAEPLGPDLLVAEALLDRYKEAVVQPAGVVTLELEEY